MRKFFNTLFYGDRKTKIYLWSIILLIVMAVGCCVLFMITIKLPWILGTAFCLIVAFIVGRTCSLSDAKDPLSIEGQQSGDAGNRSKKKPEQIEGSNSLGRNRRDKELSEEDELFLRKNTREKESDEAEPDEADPDEALYLAAYNKNKLKKLFVTYKVKKEHRPVIIDSCPSRKIRHCPAYLWVSWNKVHFLVLEEKPRVFTLDSTETLKIRYEKGAEADPEKDYAGIRNSKLVNQIFGPLIPVCYDDIQNRRRTYHKNLYIVGEDIRLTNHSAHSAFELLKAGFELPDEERIEQRFGGFSKEAYKQKVLLQDGVLSVEEYKSKIKSILQGMTEAKISDQEFHSNLEIMVTRQLITKEYAEYYISVRHESGNRR